MDVDYKRHEQRRYDNNWQDVVFKRQANCLDQTDSFASGKLWKEYVLCWIQRDFY